MVSQIVHQVITKQFTYLWIKWEKLNPTHFTLELPTVSSFFSVILSSLNLLSENSKSGFIIWCKFYN